MKYWKYALDFNANKEKEINTLSAKNCYGVRHYLSKNDLTRKQSLDST